MRAGADEDGDDEPDRDEDECNETSRVGAAATGDWETEDSREEGMINHEEDGDESDN